MLFLFEGFFFSSECLGKAALFYCDSPWAFHIYILCLLCSQIAYDWGFVPRHYIDPVPKATRGGLMWGKFVLSLYWGNISKEINSHTNLSTIMLMCLLHQRMWRESGPSLGLNEAIITGYLFFLSAYYSHNYVFARFKLTSIYNDLLTLKRIYKLMFADTNSDKMPCSITQWK